MRRRCQSVFRQLTARLRTHPAISIYTSTHPHIFTTYVPFLPLPLPPSSIHQIPLTFIHSASFLSFPLQLTFSLSLVKLPGFPSSFLLVCNNPAQTTPFLCRTFADPNRGRSGFPYDKHWPKFVLFGFSRFFSIFGLSFVRKFLSPCQRYWSDHCLTHSQLSHEIVTVLLPIIDFSFANDFFLHLNFLETAFCHLFLD